MHAERIGHGYRVVKDAKLYLRCLKDRVHFETCPNSSILTGSVPIGDVYNHPILQGRDLQI
jgi:adenosine deaminase